MKPVFISLRIKMLVVIVIRITIVYVAMYIWIYTSFTNSTARSLQANLETVLKAGTASLNGDAIAALAAGSQPDTADSRYQALAAWFAQFKNYNPGANAYLYYQPAPGRLVVLADGLALQDPKPAQAYQAGQQLDPSAGSLLQAGLTTETADLELHSGRQGSKVVSGITPIYNSSGKVVAALAVEVPPDLAVQDQLQARANLLPLLGLVYLLLSFSVWFITGNLTRSVRGLDLASRRIGEGDYTAIEHKPGLFPDEISHLTQTFNQMAAKVRGREETLRKQVEKLTIQVDQAKRQQAVKEVVDSDFFQDLQTKAKSLRENHQASDAAE